MKFIKENWFKIILAICALIISFSYLYNILAKNRIENRRVNIEVQREDRLSPIKW